MQDNANIGPKNLLFKINQLSFVKLFFKRVNFSSGRYVENKTIVSTKLTITIKEEQ